MTTAHARFHLVVGVDLSEHADAVLMHAFDEALRHERPTLHLLAVAREAGTEDRVGQALVMLVRESLGEAVPAEKRADWTILLHVRHGSPEQEIVDLAAETHADRIVVGRFGVAQHPRGVSSFADRVVALADCPVLVVMPPRDTTASDRQCVACTDIRRQSAGEQWFCTAHHADWAGHLVFVLPPMATGHGLF
jgi:nucleotide-binding universal stress UspA family protein